MRTSSQFILPSQLALYQSTARLVCYVAGFGSGKTAGAVIKAFQLACVNPGCRGAFVEPSYRMIQDVALPEFKKFLDRHKIRYVHHKQMMNIDIYTGGSEPSVVMFRSADNPDSLKGPNLAWVVCDEAGLMDEEAAKIAQSRVGRAEGMKQAQLILCGTPEGGPGTWFGRWAEYQQAPGTVLIRARTADNPFLPKFYLEGLRQKLSDLEFDAYCNGMFVAEGGQVYRFNTEEHVEECPYPTQDTVEVYADFNVGRMGWLIARHAGGTIHIVDEVVGVDTYTEEHIPRLRDRLMTMGLFMSGVKMIGDASARQQRTNAKLSDVAHLTNAGLRWKGPTTNPPVQDRIAAVNQGLKTGILKIHPRCTELIRCLSTQGRDKNGDPDKKGGMDHLPDALGYGQYSNYPVTFPRGNRSRYH